MTVIVNPTLPNILTNGTTADATQVMANFASIISQINTNAAENGANSSITSLSGLTTPLSVPQGGTGDTTLAMYNVLMGNGSGGITQVAPAAATSILTSNGASAFPTFQNLGVTQVTNALGYTPVQNGTGIGQTGITDIVKIGWSSASGASLRATVDTTDLGYFMFSSNNPANGIGGNTYTSIAGINAPALYDNGNRVWSPGNYLPFGYGTLGSHQIFVGISVTPNTTFAAPSGYSGTWLSLSLINTTPSGSGFCTFAVRVA